tara:strand:- start:217 stop:411 length:195 start_codon:yes stop_codon:yes gene_type:complete
MQTEKNTNDTNEYKPYFDLLDTMQGGMNMYGAPSMLRELFPKLGRREAVDITTAWMKSKVGESD